VSPQSSVDVVEHIRSHGPSVKTAVETKEG